MWTLVCLIIVFEFHIQMLLGITSIIRWKDVELGLVLMFRAFFDKPNLILFRYTLFVSYESFLE